jgi:Tfp pilus assembly protein PilX
MNLNRILDNHNKGFAMILVLILLVVVSILGIAIVHVAGPNFKITKKDGDIQSAFYIAEAGINNTVDLINTKVNELYITETDDDFFSSLQSYMSNPFILNSFESNFGSEPIATTTVTGARAVNASSADYTLTSIGRIKDSTKTVSMVLTVNRIVSEGSSMGNIFIYGPSLTFQGSSLNGEGGSIVSGAMTKHDLNGGASLNVSNLYFGGDVNMYGGSASFGSETNPGKIYVKGNLDFWDGTRSVFGDVHVDGNFRLKDARLFGNVYVKGNLELGWTPTINKQIFYTGTITSPDNYSADILAKCVKVADVPSFTIPTMDFELKDDSWYMSNGYAIRGDVTEEVIPDNVKMLVDSYISKHHSSPEGNVIIVSKGNIDIDGNRKVRGVLIALNGSVSYGGGSFEGVVISKDGFLFKSGGNTVNMLKLSDFFTAATMPITVSGGTGAGGGNGGGSTEGRVIIKSTIKER